MSKLPSFQFYPGDWLKDPALRRVSQSARGVWMDLLCLMFECEERGVLATGGQAWTNDEIARAITGDPSVTITCLHELIGAGVVHRNSSDALYSKRLVRDEEKRRADRNRQQKKRSHADVTPMSQHSSSSTSSSTSSSKDIAAKSAARATRWPEGFCLSEELRKYAVDHGVEDPVAEWQKFENNHRGKGSRFIEWHRAWYTWVGNYHEFRRGNVNGIERRNHCKDAQVGLGPELIGIKPNPVAVERALKRQEQERLASIEEYRKKHPEWRPEA